MRLIQKVTLLVCGVIVSCMSSLRAEVISANSIIRVSIKAVPSQEQSMITDQYTVSSDGFIKLPLLDSPIKASGVSGATLSRRIEAAYKAAEIYNHPLINVISSKDEASSAIDAKMVTIGGFVSSAGPRAYSRNMTLFQAVSAAGGVNPFGSSKRVELHRNGKKYTYHDPVQDTR